MSAHWPSHFRTNYANFFLGGINQIFPPPREVSVTLECFFFRVKNVLVGITKSRVTSDVTLFVSLGFLEVT